MFSKKRYNQIIYFFIEHIILCFIIFSDRTYFMKFLYSFLLAFITILTLSFSVVFAEDLKFDLDAGEQVFSQNCIGCHAGGNNLVNPAKTLSLSDLHDNDKDSVEAIVYQVTNGASGMPVFSGRLSDEDIFNVANFVFNQAKNNSW